MAKITKVPNGPLIKKKGPFKGSTLKNGGTTTKQTTKPPQNGESFTKDGNEYTYTKQVTRPEGKRTYEGTSTDQATAMKIANFKIRNTPSDSLTTVKRVVKKNGGPVKKAKSGSKVKKAFLGSALGGVGKSLLGGGLGNIGGMFGGGGLDKMIGSLSGKKAPANVMDTKAMKKGGSVKKKAGMHKMPNGSMMKNSAMKSGGKIKTCKGGC